MVFFLIHDRLTTKQPMLETMGSLFVYFARTFHFDVCLAVIEMLYIQKKPLLPL